MDVQVEDDTEIATAVGQGRAATGSMIDVATDGHDGWEKATDRTFPVPGGWVRVPRRARGRDPVRLSAGRPSIDTVRGAGRHLTSDSGR